MSIVIRWRLGIILLLIAVVSRPAVQAQTLTGDAGTQTAPADAGASTMLTSGAADSGAAPQPAAPAAPGASTGGDDLFGGGPPPQAITARPDPTPEQLEALRALEAEVNGFIERGMGFRRSVNGLLAREHDRQLDRVRRTFDRQIQAERAAEAEARRHAIQVFERFLEVYPEDAERTPDVMFRLAELYFDEAAYAKLDADERIDRQIAERRAAGQTADDLQAPPVDYRCSILLYRNIVARFPTFRLRDATHYLLGWVLKEMSHEDEAITAYKGLVCPSHFHYESERAFDLTAPLQPVDSPIACGNLFAILRQRAPQLISAPNASTADDAGDAAPLDPQVAALVEAARADSTSTVPIPRDYSDCEPIRGANGQPSRYAGETWYYIGDYHFDNARDDQGNALAIAAYQAAMRASERRRTTTARPGQTAVGIRGASETTATLSGAGQSPDAARMQFDSGIEYGAFWSKSLYKVGWAYFRMQNGYPQALRNFSYLLDYYDFAGAEAAASGNRTDTIKWIGVIFSESSWGSVVTGDDETRCQQLVESVARPPAEATRPFDCAGIMRIASPFDAAQVMARRGANTQQRPAAVPGRATYIPQDRPWTPEAYLELANDYFQQTKYYEAITLYRMFLELYPLHFQAPRVAESIAISYERQRQFDAAIATRGTDLARYIEGTQWWAANADHPDAQRYAEQIARNSMHDTAIQHHQAAGRLRQEALNLVGQARSATGAQQADLQARAVDALRRADQEYTAAVQAYTQFIDNYPNDEAAYEFRYNRADALYWSKNYLEAARAYALVRDSNENDQYLVASAYMVVKSMETHLRTLAQSRQLDPCLAIRAGLRREDLVDDTGNPLLPEAQATACTQPPAANGQVSQVQIPEVVQQLMDARIAYARLVPPPQDNEASLRDVVQIDTQRPENNPPYRPKFAYLNARTLYRFGQVQQAEQLLRRILETYCEDPTVAAATFADLNNLLVAQNRQEEVEALASAQLNRTCAGVEARREQLIGVLQDREFRLAMDTYQRAERAPAAESHALYEQAARAMEAAVRSNRNHPQAALAAFYTALAYERTNRFDTATQQYIRITQDFNNTRNAAGQELSGEDLSQRINILEQSNFRAAVNLERTFDYDNAIRYYNNVATDARFNGATDHDAHVHDALASIALITTNLGRWQQARQAWQNFLPRANAGRERASAEFNIAEIPYRSGEWAEALRSLQDYLRRVPSSADNAEYRVQAQYEIALAYRNMNNDAQYRRALRDVAQVFRASGQQPGSRAAAWAAEALFRDLDDQVTAFTRNQFQRGDATALRTQITTFKNQLQAIDTSAREVIALRGGEYSIGALTRQGEAHEYLATQEARIGELIQLSRAQQDQLDRATRAIAQLERAADTLDRVGRSEQAQAARDRASQLRDEIDNRRTGMIAEVQTRFDEEATAERSLAIINYGTAVHTARSQNVPTPFAARALERMRTEENRALLDTALARQQAFSYTPGMFNSEAPGATVSQSTPIATPGLATE